MPETYQEFRERFKKHHTCGADILGSGFTYHSGCPRCNPDSSQWEKACESFYESGETVRFNGWWYTPVGAKLMGASDGR